MPPQGLKITAMLLLVAAAAPFAAAMDMQMDGSSSAPAPAHDHSEHDHDSTTTTTTSMTMASTPAASSDCIADPTAVACLNYRLEDATIEQRIDQLCTAMPYMIGCTLHTACTDGTQQTDTSSRYCQPFSLLADICVDMPSMRGCEEYTAMCAPGTVIKQCLSEGPLPNVLLTTLTAKAIIDMCSTHGMPGCEDCTSSFSNCADPMSTISQLCLGMPGMSQCSSFVTMCASAGDTFQGLCGRGDQSSESLPPMKMYMHQSTFEIILFKEWVPQSTAAYVGYCIAIFFAAVLVQLMKGWRVRQEVKWAAAQRVACCSPTCPDPKSKSHNQEQQPTKNIVYNGGAIRSCCAQDKTAGGAVINQEASIESDLEAGATSHIGSDTGSGSGVESDVVSSMDAPMLTGAMRETQVAAGRDSNKGWFASCPKFSPKTSLVARNAVRACFTTFVVFIDYMLMLVVMTFNVGLIVSAVLGFGIGAFLFGHMGETTPSGRSQQQGGCGTQGCRVNKAAAGGGDRQGSLKSLEEGKVAMCCQGRKGNGGARVIDDDGEVQFVDLQTCCNSRHI